MYQRFYGLRELPFELTPNPRFLFLPPRHREALSNLQYGLSSAKAITVLIGEAGTGKTTLLRAALESEPCLKVQAVYLNNPVLTPQDFVRLLAIRFDLSAQARESKAVFLEEVERVLRERRANGTITALVVDEAQSVSVELLEELRLLANIETASEKLLPLVLAGQPELHARLNDPALRQLKQRVALRCEIGPFDLSETAAYIASRVTEAGGSASGMFSREAVALIQEYSGGIPRTISVLCDNALVSGMALGRKPVDHAIIVEVGRDFYVSPSDADGKPSRDAGGKPSPDPGNRPSPDMSQARRTESDDPPSAETLEALPKRQRSIWFRRARNPFSEPAGVVSK